MKKTLATFLLGTVLAGTAGRAGEAVKPCCADDVKGVTQAAQLSSRSIYQADSTWTDDAGRPVKLASLKGRPVVLAMFFTNCEFACPIIVGNMMRIQEALPPESRANARFVLVSFDSERDTSAALRIYRERMRLGTAWVLLHGQPDDVRELAMVLGVKYARDSRGQFAHSNLITVLNSAGEIAYRLAGLESDISAAEQAVIAAAR